MSYTDKCFMHMNRDSFGCSAAAAIIPRKKDENLTPTLLPNLAYATF